MDADLLGMPIRLTVSERAHKAGGVEAKRRDRAEKWIIPLAEVIPAVQAEIAALQAVLDAALVEAAFEGE